MHNAVVFRLHETCSSVYFRCYSIGSDIIRLCIRVIVLLCVYNNNSSTKHDHSLDKADLRSPIPLPAVESWPSQNV